MNADLYSKTIRLLKMSSISFSEISKGAGVGQRWLFDLANGRFKDPGVRKIQRLHDYLSKRNEKAA